MLKRVLQLLSDSLVYGIGGVLGQLISFLLLPLYTRRLDPTDYGVLAMLAMISPVFTTLAAAGMKSALFQQFYRTEAPHLRKTVCTTALIAVTLSTICWLALGLVGADLLGFVLIGNNTATTLVQLSLASAAIGTLIDIPLAVLQAARRARTVAMLNTAQLLIVVSLSAYMVIALRWGVQGIVLGGLVGNALSLMLCLLSTASFFTRSIDFVIWKKMALYSLPFLPHRLQSAAMAFWGDYVVRTYLGLSEAGLYTMANRFTLPIGLLFGAIMQAWNPYKHKVYAEEADSPSFFRSTFTYFFFLLSYCWLIVSAWGPEALRIMTTPAFHAASTLIWIVALMRATQALYPMVATAIELKSDTRLIPLISFAALVVSIVFSILLVPMMGAYGAAAATSLAWLAMAIGAYILAQRQLAIRYDFVILICLALLAAFFTVLANAVQSFGMTQRICSLVFLSAMYPVLGLLIVSRSTTEQHRVKHLIGSLSTIFMTRLLGKPPRSTKTAL